MNYTKRILDLCPQNIRCKSDDCSKLHPRIFAGLCILHLQNKCENGDQCQLLHKTRSELIQLLKSTRINGVYSFNLCKNQEKCEDRECQYLHRDWAKNICLQEIELDECIDRNTCKYDHISWDNLKKVVYQRYNIHNLNPEDFKLGKDHTMLAKICVEYLNGECPLQQSCLKEHVDWEHLKSKDVNKLQEFRRKPCTNFYSISQYIPEKENETHMQFFEEINNKLLKNDIRHSNIVDVLFILDCTGSMQRWLDSAKQNIKKIIDEFKSINTARTLVRTAFIGYRDFEDKENIFYREFTTNSQLIVDFIEHQQSYGGGDIPEDVVGALNKGLQLNFSRHPDSTLCTFLICDSPCHGPYHEYEDRYFYSVKEGELEQIMSKYQNLKKRSFFTCFKITNGTDIMFEKMKSRFKDLIISQSTAEGLKDAVVFSLKSSFYKSQMLPKTNSTSEKIRATYKKNSEQLFKDEIEGNYWQNFENKLEESKVKGQTLLIVKREQKQVPSPEQGTQCVIFDLFDVANNRNLVVKLPLMMVQKYKQNQQLTDDEINEYELKIKTRFITLSLAQRLAYTFRQKTKNIQGAPPLFYVSPILYELDEPFYGVKQIFGETHIDIPNSNEWTKFSNNAEYVSSQHNYYTAFSHFTYEETNHQFLITDLQGKLNILSDPAIQTTNKDALKVMQDDCNLQQKGILYFLLDQHKECHKICQELNINDQQCSHINYSKGWDKQPEDSIYIVCDGCGDLSEQTYQQYLESNASLCENCKNENNDTIKLTCRCCKQKYDCAYNQCLRKNEIPENCDQCRLRCKYTDYHCYYCDCYCETRLTKLQIESSVYIFCSESIRYLRAIKCASCSELYDFSELIDKYQYCNPYYLCKKCN